MSADFSHRGFPISISFVGINMWKVTTTIYAPEDLVHKWGDRVTMDYHRPGDSQSNYIAPQ
jgi:hypothetical protein